LFETCALELVSFELTIHELCKTVFENRKHIWNLVRADGLNQAQETALHILVIISQQLVNVLIKVLVCRDDHPLRVHLEQKKEGQNRLSSEHNRLVFKKLADCTLE
jgi:hypothetical protein